MKAAAVLVLLLVAALLAVSVRDLRAEPFGRSQVFNEALFSAVAGSAYAFMAPRTLDPIPIPQLAVWGLQGITALDLHLTVDLHEGGVALLRDDQPMLVMPPPAPGDAAGWGATTALLARTAWNASPEIRRSGNGGFTQDFFDALFHHLDPYSRYLPPDAASEEIEHRAGDAGTGITPAAHGSRIIIAALAADSPAADAGLRAGDAILRIDGESMAGARPAEAAALLAGPEGSVVGLEVRAADGRVRRVSLQRALIAEQTVFLRHTRDLDVIRITRFDDDTADQLRVGLLQAVQDGHKPSGIVIDLRGNRGGVLRQAVAAANLLVTHGTLARTVGRNPAADHDFAANDEDVAAGAPVVVLVDGGTASSAEIFAAAVADLGRGVVVGSATLGKGLVQTVATLPNGGEVFITWSRVLAPSGWPLQALGVLPQVCTSLGRAALDSEIAALAAGRAPLLVLLDKRRMVRPDTAAADILALRESCPAAAGGEADLTAARTLLLHPAAYAAGLLAPAAQ